MNLFVYFPWAWLNLCFFPGHLIRIGSCNLISHFEEIVFIIMVSLNIITDYAQMYYWKNICFIPHFQVIGRNVYIWNPFAKSVSIYPKLCICSCILINIHRWNWYWEMMQRDKCLKKDDGKIGKRKYSFFK